MIAIIKEVYIFALILLVFSYLVPKDGYKTYIQFFIGIFLLVVLLKPVLKVVMTEDASSLTRIFEEMDEGIERIEGEYEWEYGTEGDIYELFIFEGERQ